ncbi:MAG: ABC transporter substrate-binding protein [Nitrospinota bacterium]
MALKKSLGVVFVALFVLAGLAAPVPVQGAKGLKIKMAGFPGGGTGFLITVGLKEGIFKKHGIQNLRAVFPERDLEAFAYGAIQAAFLNAGEVASLRIRGWEAAQIGPGLVGYSHVWSLKGKPYKSVMDLKGKKFAHFGWDSGGTTEFLVLTKALLNFDARHDLKHVIVPPPAVKKVLDRGDVEAALVPLGPAIAMELEPDKYQKVWGPHTALWEKKTGSPIFTAALAVNEEILERPEVAKSLSMAVQEITRFVLAKPYDAMKKYRWYFGYNEAKANQFAKAMKEGRIFSAEWNDKVVDGQWEFIKTAASMRVYLKKLPPGGRAGLFRVYK